MEIDGTRVRPRGAPPRVPRNSPRLGPPTARTAVAALALVAAAGCGLAPTAADSAGNEPTPAWQQSGAPTPHPDSKATPGRKPAAIPDGTSAQLVRFYDQRLQWRECGQIEGHQCTTLEVPLDYDDPGGATLELAVLRVPAKDQERRIGSLVLNPGGPGGSGVEYAQSSSVFIGEQLRQRYDIVGFDPRGVAQSAPVDCVSDRQLDRFLAADGSPDTEQERQELGRLVERFAEGCEKRSGDLLKHVGTRDAARDIDILRGALGDPELYYFGASYGTYLGTTYAELFPDRVGRAVLDGAVPPDLTGTEIGLGQAKGFERALRAFIEDCLRQDHCPLGTSVEEAYATFDTLLANLDQNPLPGDGERRLTQSLGVNGIIGSLYSTLSWPKLRTGLEAALNGDGSYLLSYADEYSQRYRDGYHGNGSEAILAVNCLDRPDVSSIADAVRVEPQFEVASPRFGAYIAWGALACAYWPQEVQTQPHKVRAPGAGPILVIGTSRDPATIVEWSEQLADQLESGVLITREGDGHTAYADGNPCVNEAVERYLLAGDPPEQALHCPAE